MLVLLLPCLERQKMVGPAYLCDLKYLALHPSTKVGLTPERSQCMSWVKAVLQDLCGHALKH